LKRFVELVFLFVAIAAGVFWRNSWYIDIIKPVGKCSQLARQAGPLRKPTEEV